MSRLPLSAVILTLNEIERIERCLESVRAFSQVVIVDSLSSDGTLDRARELWNEWGENPERLTLVSRTWPGFTAARNQSLSYVREPWVLWLDADEWVSSEFCEWCRSELGRTPSRDTAPLYRVSRQSFFLGSRIRHGGWYPDFKRRLALSARAVWRGGPHGSDVHEDLDVSASGDFAVALTAKGEIFHEPFRNEDEQRATNELYSGLLAQGLAKRWSLEGRSPPSEVWIRAKVCVKFVENYIFKLGFLDGEAGLKIAQGSAWSMGQRLRKARELMAKKSLG